MQDSEYGYQVGFEVIFGVWKWGRFAAVLQGAGPLEWWRDSLGERGLLWLTAGERDGRPVTTFSAERWGDVPGVESEWRAVGESGAQGEEMRAIMRVLELQCFLDVIVEGPDGGHAEFLGYWQGDPEGEIEVLLQTIDSIG